MDRDFPEPGVPPSLPLSFFPVSIIVANRYLSAKKMLAEVSGCESGRGGDAPP
jgi:hypothetical protein